MDQDLFPKTKPQLALQPSTKLMSRFLNNFQRLNIEDMPETRSQRSQRQTQSGQQGAERPGAERPAAERPGTERPGAGRPGAGRPRAGRSSTRGGHIMQTAIRPHTPIQGHSGLLYDTQNLSPESAQRANEGLKSEYYVDQLRGCETRQRTTYYAFQLKKPVSVRIHDPANGIKVECTCEEFKDSKSTCSHIYWLFDALRLALIDKSNATTHTVQKGEVVKQLSDLYGLIGPQLKVLPDLLNQARGDDAESDSDQSEELEKSSATSQSTSRKETVRDMLSVFDGEALPSEYGIDFPERAPASPSGTELYVPGNLAETIYQVAIRDQVFFRHLRKVITRDICAGVYFRKQLAKAKELMAQLDRFAERGPTRQVEAGDVDVPACARGLRLIVHQICENRDVRTAKGPLGSEIISQAIVTLVEILEEVVCERNRDIFDRAAQEPFDEDDGRYYNLFTYLVGNPPQLDDSAPIAMRDDFIIDRLQKEFPMTEWRLLFERLNTIIDSIHDQAPREERAMAYARKLETMLRGYTADADVFEPSSSSVQRRRPTLTTSPREPRRRRLE